MASLSAYLRKLKYGSYTRSEKAPVYEKIAKQYETDAQTVYEIAHGKAIRSQSELVIVDALIEAGIMSQSRSDI